MTDQRLEKAQTLIAAGDNVNARQILIPLCREAHSAEAFWLLSQVVEKPEHIEKALRHAVKLDPTHESATMALTALRQPETAVPLNIFRVSDLTPLPPLIPALEEKEEKINLPTVRQRKKRARQNRRVLRLMLVAVVGIVMGVAFFSIYQNMTYVIPAPFTGPYYVSHIAVDESEPIPCYTYTVYGDVIGGSGLSVQVNTEMGFSQSVVVGSDERYQVDIPGEYVPLPPYHSPDDDLLLRTYDNLMERAVSIQLLNGAGVSQSGTRTTPFYKFGCALYTEFSRFPSGRRFGSPTESSLEVVTQEAYQVYVSALTSIPEELMVGFAPTFLDCGWVGVLGRAYLPDGTLAGVDVHASGPGSSGFFSRTGEFAERTGLEPFAGVWMGEIEPGTYFVEFSYVAPGYYPHLLTGLNVTIPQNHDCNNHVILMSMFPQSLLDEPPYRVR